MRSVFNKTLIELAAKDERIYLILADIGFGEIEPFCTSFPERSFNVGICEQNMTGIAAGIALNGNIVFTYSIANFPTFRCFEQIRNDICYHNANVNIITIGGGVAYGPLGTSHQATEDLSVMRGLPNMVVVAPGDLVEVELLTKAMVEWDGPCYMRCGYKGEPVLYDKYPDLKIGKAITIRDGSDITLIAAGEMLPTAVEISNAYKKEGLNVRVLSMHTIKPIDTAAIIKAAEETKRIISLEENNIIGGLGGAVSEVLAEQVSVPVKFKRIGINDVFPSRVGYREYIRSYYGFSKEDIVKTIKEMCS
jgi:transketolase